MYCCQICVQSVPLIVLTRQKIMHALCRCGEDLKSLFSNATVQHFLNSIPMRELGSDKAIYQAGTLRKVSGVYIMSLN